VAVAEPPLVDVGGAGPGILVVDGHRRAGAALVVEVADHARAVAVGVAADAVGAVAAGAVGVGRADGADARLAIVVGVAGLVAGTGVVGRARRDVAAGPE